MFRSLMFICLAGAMCMGESALRAATIDLPHGAELSVIFAMPGFNPNNLGAIFPTSIGLELVGSVPAGSGKALIPGSSESYYSGILMQAYLESGDGSVKLPLFDADSWRLGLSLGSLVADVTGIDTALIFAQAAVSLNQSEAIFGSTGRAQFVIQNLGGDFTIGLGPDYSISNAILAPLTSDNGSVQTAGYLQSMQMTPASITTQSLPTPEPATFGIVAAGGAALFWWRRRFKQ